MSAPIKTDLIQRAVHGIAYGMKQIIRAWDAFWFKGQPLLLVSLFRFYFFTVLGCFYALRWVDYDFLFTNSGILPIQFLSSVFGEEFRSRVPWHLLLKNPSVGFALHGVFVAGLFALALGWIGRGFNWLLFILHLAFFQRNPLTIFGADLSATAWFACSCLMDTNKFFHFQFWRKDWRRSWSVDRAYEQKGDFWNTIGIRFTQIQLCSIYGNSGLDKLKGMSWWRGDALWLAFANPQIVDRDLSFLSHVPWMIYLLSFSTLFWEIYFPVLVWVSKVRPWVLLFGFMLHLGIAGLMHLYFFAAIMLAAYILFLNPASTRSFMKRALRQR